MTRREFIALAGATAAWPLIGRAQQIRVRTLGFLGATTHPVATQWTAAFVERLQELGWIEGRTIIIDYRWADGSNVRAAEIAGEFVRLKVT